MMNCEDYQPLLEQLFDGEADSRTTQQAQAHLNACAACARVFESLRLEQDLYLRYEFDARPAPSFWQEVLARAPVAAPHDARARAATNTQATSAPAPTRPQHMRLRDLLAVMSGAFSTPRFSPSLTAALVFVAVALTIGVMRYINSREGMSNQTLNQTTTRTASRNTSSQKNDSSPNNDSAAPSSTRETEQAGIQNVEKHAGGNNRAGAESESGKADRRTETAGAKFDDASKRDRMVLASSRENMKRAATAPHLFASAQTPDELVREAEQKYIAAIRLLSQDVRRNRSRLDAQDTAKFEQTLSTIDRTIAGTRRAVREHPGDPVAVNYMLTAYAKKVEVLREMARY